MISGNITVARCADVVNMCLPVPVSSPGFARLFGLIA